MNILIKGGRLLDPDSQTDTLTDIYLGAGKIAAIGAAPADFVIEHTINAEKQIICPGLIDLCAHTGEPGLTKKGSISSESMAAIAGGITTLVTPPCTKPVIDTPAVAQLIKDRCQETGNLNIHPMGAITQGLKGEQLAPMAALAKSGCIAFTNSRYPTANSLILTRCLEYAATHDLLVIFQPQDDALTAKGCMHAGETCTRLGLNAIPTTAETIEVARCLLLVEQTGARAHFGQLSCAQSVRMIKQARQNGLEVSADVSIQNLLLCDENLNGFNSDFHLIPPLRSRQDRAGLIQGVIADDIQAICSDHQPQEQAAKEAPFADTEPGMSNLETLLPLSLLLAEQQKIPLIKLIEKLTLAPAKILGLEEGRLAIGSPADLCIFNPDIIWELTPETSYSAGKNSPFMNYPLKGKVTHTIFNGKIVYSLNT